MDAHPGVARAAADLLGDVLVVEPAAVVQQERQAVRFGQLGELAAQRVVQARTLLGVGFLAFIHTRSRMFEGEMTFMTALPAAPAHQLQGAGAGDAHDPAQRGGLGVAGMGAEAPGVAAQVQEGLLGRILGQGMLAGDAEGGLVDGGAMAGDQHRPCLGIGAPGQALEDG